MRDAAPDGAADHTALDGALLDAVASSVAVLNRPAAIGTPLPTLGVAFSGGTDSSVLLDLAWRLRERGAGAFGEFVAVHVHHGLQAQADDWVRHCERFCAERGIALQVERVRVIESGGGIEEAARRARYGALAAAARRGGLKAVLCAHHLDDRIEGFLLSWMRGCGPLALSGPPRSRPLPLACASDAAYGAAAGDVLLIRPLLDVSREDLRAYARRRGLPVIEDPSNADPRFARGALRTRVIPALAAMRPGFREAAARTMDLVGEQAELLAHIARDDLAACTRGAQVPGAPGAPIALQALRSLPPLRAALVVREWLRIRGFDAPPRARLDELLRQIHAAGTAAQPCLRLGGHELRAARGELQVHPLSRPVQGGAPASAYTPVPWGGEREIALPGWNGRLRFTEVGDEEPGLDAQWLRRGPLTLAARHGGERIRVHGARPTRTLKQAYQEAGIDRRDRAALPLLWCDGTLAFAAGLGSDVRLLGQGGGARVRLDWLPL